MTTVAEETQAEFQNNDVRVIARRKNHCVVELEVHALAVMVRAAKRDAIKSVNKSISFAGFRKGKAPEEMILKMHAPQVEKELHKKLADAAFVEAQKLVRIPSLNNNASISFQMKKLVEEGDAELLFSFETEPAIPSVDGALFTAKPVTRPEVAEKQLEEAIRQMRFFYAQWTPIEDRPIQDGDAIMINLETEEEGGWQQVFNHVRFEVSKERMADWMKKLVQGAKSGDVLEGVSEPDATATEEEQKEFKPKKVRLSILKVEQAHLPELNDEFAVKVGAANIEAMRQSVSNLLNNQADDKVKEGLREQVNDFLLEQYPFDLPRSLIETEKKHRLQQLMQDPKFKRNWNHFSQEERKNVETKLETEANQAVRLFYLSRKIVNEAKIPLTHQEIQDEAIQTLNSFGVRKFDKIPKEVYALALSKVMLAKAQDHLLKI